MTKPLAALGVFAAVHVVLLFLAIALGTRFGVLSTVLFCVSAALVPLSIWWHRSALDAGDFRGAIIVAGVSAVAFIAAQVALHLEDQTELSADIGGAVPLLLAPIGLVVGAIMGQPPKARPTR